MGKQKKYVFIKTIKQSNTYKLNNINVLNYIII